SMANATSGRFLSYARRAMSVLLCDGETEPAAPERGRRGVLVLAVLRLDVATLGEPVIHVGPRGGRVQPGPPLLRLVQLVLVHLDQLLHAGGPHLLAGPSGEELLDEVPGVRLTGGLLGGELVRLDVGHWGSFPRWGVDLRTGSVRCATPLHARRSVGRNPAGEDHRRRRGHGEDERVCQADDLEPPPPVVQGKS